MTDAAPSYLDWSYAIAALRKRHEAGEHLTPAELAAIVDDAYVAELHRGERAK